MAELAVAGPLPWERGEKSRPNRRLFYQVTLGAIRMEDATARLLEVFEDTEIERLSVAGHAPIAVLTLDKAGKPIKTPAVAISSFAWGLPVALAKRLEELGEWKSVEAKLLEAIDGKIRRTDETTGEDKPIDRGCIESAFEHLLELLRLPRELVEPPLFAIRVYHWWKAEEPPDPPPMGSFFLTDLANAKAAVGSSLPTCLVKYVSLRRPAGNSDLLADDALLADWVAPSRTPAGRWPTRAGHSLVTLQQAAINLAMSGEDSSQLLPVNGPPGTGKTTILRDLVAAVVIQRAQRMAEFDNPGEAFSHSERAKLDGAFAHIYKLNDRLKGFEIVVASSNNKAVENISKELPSLAAIDEKRPLRYFNTVSDFVAQGARSIQTGDKFAEGDLFASPTPKSATWGLIAAVLGNAANRFAFKQTAWSDGDFGLRTYLLEASGTPQIFEVIDEKTGRVTERRKPLVITKEKPPKGEEEAKRKWKAARARFRSIFDGVSKRLATMERGRLSLREMTLSNILKESDQTVESLIASLKRHQNIVAATVSDVQGAAIAARDAEKALVAHNQKKPSILAKIFSTDGNTWRSEFETLSAKASAAHHASQDAESLMSGLKAKVSETMRLLEEAQNAAVNAKAQSEEFEKRIEEALTLSGDRFADAAFFERERSDTHRDTPWIDEQTNGLRADLFEAAMALHRAFIDSAAKPIRNNLDVLFRTFFGKSAWNEKVRPLLPDLWATFHCVVPVVSSTFASVERMYGALPRESIGWLLLDEAGQASPQHAVGALMRAKRAVVVGDPLQLEPVTSLPTELARRIAGEFGVNPDDFFAPEASVQTLSDAASEYGTTIDRNGEIIRLGVPLIVHRRCSDPMFSLANSVAYADLMVNGRSDSSSAIRTILGPSHWIDVKPGRCDDKWSENEWIALKALIERLAAHSLADPDFYVVSPFRIVASRLRDRIANMPEMGRWTSNAHKWVQERVGTIHTVQGREADTIFVVLGAAEIGRQGARKWAGAKVNLLNVAVTRAKENIYVVGHRFAWASAGTFGELERRLPSALKY